MQTTYPLHSQCVQKINEQVAKEFEAFYGYQALARYFEQANVALFNVAKLFQGMAQEELEHAKILQGYLIQRGAGLSYRDLKAFNPDKEINLQRAFELALGFEGAVFASLREVHALALEHDDAHLVVFIEDTFYTEQVKAEFDLNVHLATIRRLGTGIGEFLFDREYVKA